MLRCGRLVIGLALLATTAFAQQTPPGTPATPATPQGTPAAAPALNTTTEQASYAIGMNIGRNIRSDGVEVDAEALLQGLRDALIQAAPRLTDEQCRIALQQFQQEQQAKKAERQKLEGEKNKRDGAAFLAANKAKQGVVTLPSGLQYEVLKKGTGPTPKVTDTVQTHYHGTLIDGTVFDSSVNRGQPAEFPVGGVIRGWTEALQLMKVGDKWRLAVPAKLAYGPRGAGGKIGPNTVLVFEVELLGIK